MCLKDLYFHLSKAVNYKVKVFTTALQGTCTVGTVFFLIGLHASVSVLDECANFIFHHFTHGRSFGSLLV